MLEGTTIGSCHQNDSGTVSDQGIDPTSNGSSPSEVTLSIESVIEKQRERFWVFILLPSVLSVIYVITGILLGFSIYGTRLPGKNRVIAYIAYMLLIPLVLVSFLGTWTIFFDSDLMNERGRWNPNPWQYVGSGAVLFSGIATGLYVYVENPSSGIDVLPFGLFIMVL